MATTADNQATALRLAKAGFAVFPCQSGGDKAKQPMPFLKWREASTTAEGQILQWWRKWPDAAIGLDLAKSGLVVIDADRHGAHDGVTAFGELMASHGYEPHGVPLAATPNEGTHFFYRQPAGKQLGNSPGQLPPGVDVRGHGGYVVAPGTVMQDGRLYEVFGDIAEASDLPAWLVALIEAKRGGDQTAKNSPQSIANQAFQGGAQSDEIADLLTYIPADCGYQDWVSVLMAIHAETGGAGFHLADEWSARGGSKYPGSKELEKKWRSFKGTGISGRTLAQLARENGADLAAIAVKYNRPENYFDPVEASTAARRLIEHHDGTIADAETGELIDQAPVAEPPANVEFPPGLVGEIAQWIVATSSKPQPSLALGAALTIVGTAAGRQFMGPTMAGTVLYVLGMAPTGQGKDTPMNQVRRILKAAGMSHHLGPDEFMSFSAVVNVLVRKPLCICPMDEFGDFMRRIYDKHGGPHARAIPKVLRSAWGKNFNDMETAEWADKDSKTICVPSMSIFGCSTHEQFYTALEQGAVADGTLNRFLILEGEKRPQRVKPVADQFDVPKGIVNALRSIYLRSGELAAVWRSDPSVNPAERDSVVKLPWCVDGAEGVFDAFAAEIEARMFSEPHNVDFMVRSVEMSVRIATVIAAGRGNDSVRRDDIEFGITLARQALETMMAGASSYMAENEHHASGQKIVRMLRDRGGRMLYRDIMRSMRGMRGKDLRDLLANMCEAELLQRQEVTNAAGKGHPAIWYSVL